MCSIKKNCDKFRYFFTNVLCTCSSLFSPAPSAMPSSITNLDTTDTSITVQWGAVPCIDRNGNITNYSVRYGVEGNSENSITVLVTGTALGGTYQITGLEPVTVYDIGVAAVTSAGTGEYRDIGIITSGKNVH